MIVRSSLVSTFKRCPALAYYQYGLGLIPDTVEDNIDLAFGSLVHDAVDVFHKTNDIKDAIMFIENSDLPRGHKRKTKPVAKALLQSYAKKYPNIKVLESETTHLIGQDLCFNVGRHYWKLRLDSIILHQNRLWVGENKTTRRDYLLVRPNDQFISYYIAAKTVDPDISGVMLTVFDSEVVGVDSVFFTPSKEECSKWFKEMEFTIDWIEKCAYENIFPMDGNACYKYGPKKSCYCLPLCQARTATDREHLIKKYYTINEEAVNLSW